METAVNLLIRPPRNEYLPSQLGPTRFAIADKRYKRHDLELVNPRNLRLRCSHWEPVDEERPAKRMGCVIYLHGNSGSRMDAAENVVMLLHSFHLTYFAFDFAGAGQSEGKYISLGYHEQEDVETVLAYLKSTESVSNICLWGRSMGAVTALMYTARADERRAQGEGNVTMPATLILDSPFSSLIKLIPEVVDSVDVKGQYIKQIPKKVVGGLLGLGIPILRKAIKIRAEFDISDLEPIAVAPKCSVPAIFIQGRNDTLVRPHHTQLLYEAYGSAVKKRISIEGGHNTGRERKSISGLDGKFPRLRVNLDDLGVPHFLCRRLPYPLVKEEVVTFDSLVSVVIDNASVQLQQPFTGTRIGEYKLGNADASHSILGYGVEAIGGEVDQKLFYLRVAEPYEETDTILLFITTRADEISDILKLRIDTLLREKLTNVDMASRIEQIVQKLVARRIDEQLMQNRRKRDKEEKNNRRHNTSDGEREDHFTFRLRRSTSKLFQAMIGNSSSHSSGSSRNEDIRGSAVATHAKDSITVTTATRTENSALAAPAVSVTDVTTTVTATQSISDEGYGPAGTEECSPRGEDVKDERRSLEEPRGHNGASDVSVRLVDEVHIDENEVIGTIEEVLYEIGMVSEKDRPHLHAVISDSVREVIKRELDHHRRTERERRERELELNKDRQHRVIDQRAADKEKERERKTTKTINRTLSSREKRAQRKLQQRHQHEHHHHHQDRHSSPLSSTEVEATEETQTHMINTSTEADSTSSARDRHERGGRERSESDVGPD